jgi:hypothetical protein
MNGRILSTTLFFVLAALVVRAQDFNYTITSDTSGTYAALTSDSVLTNDSAWKHSYKIQVGFSFPFAGKNFSELTVERNSYIVFDNNRSYALMAFAGFSCKKDEQNHYSGLSYANSGSSPNRILKIQFNKVGQGEYAAEHLSYQVWLHENGRIDIVTGTHTYQIADTATVNDTLNAIQIGLINTNMDTSNRGLFLSGAADSPGSQPLNDSYPEISFIRSMPRIGMRYSFIPN